VGSTGSAAISSGAAREISSRLVSRREAGMAWGQEEGMRRLGLAPDVSGDRWTQES
jgi:hypothetical protein